MTNLPDTSPNQASHLDDSSLDAISAHLDALAHSDRACANPELAARIAKHTSPLLEASAYAPRGHAAHSAIAGRLFASRATVAWGAIAAAVLVAASVVALQQVQHNAAGAQAERLALAEYQTWSNDGTSQPADTFAWQADVTELQAELAELELAMAFGLSLESDADESF